MHESQFSQHTVGSGGGRTTAVVLMPPLPPLPVFLLSLGPRLAPSLSGPWRGSRRDFANRMVEGGSGTRGIVAKRASLSYGLGWLESDRCRRNYMAASADGMVEDGEGPGKKTRRKRAGRGDPSTGLDWNGIRRRQRSATKYPGDQCFVSRGRGTVAKRSRAGDWTDVKLGG